MCTFTCPVASAAGISVVSFSNNSAVAGEGVFVFGFLPDQQVRRIVSYASRQGYGTIGALAPSNGYGELVVATARIAAEQTGFLPSDYLVPKRRYSAFFGTDFEILLKRLKVDTLILCGGLTDVCVHYTFVDGHQHDYFCRVIEDCVAGSGYAAHEASLCAMEYLQTGARRSLDEVLTAMENYSPTH